MVRETLVTNVTGKMLVFFVYNYVDTDLSAPLHYFSALTEYLTKATQGKKHLF